MMSLPFQVLSSGGTNTAHLVQMISLAGFALDRAIARRRR
jgi:hypothetical protein